MRLSKNFWLNELIKSPTADRYDISNDPSTEHLVSLTVVTHKILQPVREQFGVITVNSGYRSPALNSKVGGSGKSQHCNGEAVDFEQLGTANADVAKWIAKHLEFDQLILEFYNPKQGANSGWVHCSHKKDGSNRGKVMTAMRVNKKTVYKSGFVLS